MHNCIVANQFKDHNHILKLYGAKVEQRYFQPWDTGAGRDNGAWHSPEAGSPSSTWSRSSSCKTQNGQKFYISLKIEEKNCPPAPLVLQVSENAVRLGAFPCQPICAHLFFTLSTSNPENLSYLPSSNPVDWFIYLCKLNSNPAVDWYDYRFISEGCSLMAKRTGLASRTA